MEKDIDTATKLVAASPKAIAEAAAALKRGRLVAFPTDTVYGVGAFAFSEAAVEKLYVAKLRPKEKAIPLLLGSAMEMAMVAREIPAVAWQLAGDFFPGGLTLVLRRSAQIPDAVTAGTDTVAVRVPDHPVALALIEAAGAPLATTSANLSGRPSAVTGEEAFAQLAGRIAIVLDGGRCPGGRESSILDLTGARPRLLREGAIAREALARVCGPIET